MAQKMNMLSIDVGAHHSHPAQHFSQASPHVHVVTAFTPSPSRTPRTGRKPVISKAQRIREKHIKDTATEMFKTFTSTVVEVKCCHNRKVMWTTIPAELKAIFNCTDLKTVDQWKQTMHGDVQIDISTFVPGDKVKMLIQSVGVSGKHGCNPLLRGVPDPKHIAQKHTLVVSPMPHNQMESPRFLPPRSPAPATPKAPMSYAAAILAASSKKERNVSFRRAQSVPPPDVTPVVLLTRPRSAKKSAQRFNGLSNARRGTASIYGNSYGRRAKTVPASPSGRFPMPSAGYSLDNEFVRKEQTQALRFRSAPVTPRVAGAIKVATSPKQGEPTETAL